ncbi:hypothetical protein JB92DRAFT_3141917 [Gautieria morchelliformis]|nr:hypothetical protein JB92DRAFT_3141917 [Gautieria morchelliformis]
MSSSTVDPATPFPPAGGYIKAIRTSSRALRATAGVTISHESIRQFLYSPAFSSTFNKLSHSHGLALPLNFPSQLSELNLISVLALVNLGSGYRVPLHAHADRGAWDSIRALVLSMYITSSAEDDGDLLSARALQDISIDKVADLMQLPTHTERPHESIPGVVVGERGGPLYDLVKIVTSTLNETGSILVSQGYPDLGSFVLEALREGERVGKRRGGGVDTEVVLEKVRINHGIWCRPYRGSQIVLAFPAFQDMAIVHGKPVYIFKKALFLLHGIALRFSSRAAAKDSGSDGSIPVPDTSSLPVFSDNVLPSILIHLGIIDLSQCTSPRITGQFKRADHLDALLQPQPTVSAGMMKMQKIRGDGPVLTEAEAYILRASAIEACEVIVEEARNATGCGWLRKLTLPELDGWLWAGAKDRADYRELGRFVLRDTAYF